MQVLVVDDCRTTSHLVQKLLTKWGYAALVASNGDQALEIFESTDGPLLVLLDWMMPGMDGPTVCRKIRQLSDKRYAYIIFLTALNDREHMLGALEAEADEFLRKPIDEEELRQRLQAGGRILALQDRLIAAQERLRIQATHDSLTGIWNRRAITDIVTRELARGDRQNHQTGLLIIDIDHFKSINDRFGHLEGDQVLRQVSARMKRLIRNYDSLGRFGGEEFLVCLPQSDIRAAQLVAQRLGDEIARTPIELTDTNVGVTVSIGVAAMGPPSRDCDALIRAADGALYRAKRSGRNKVCLAADLPSDDGATGSEEKRAPASPMRETIYSSKQTLFGE